MSHCEEKSPVTVAADEFPRDEHGDPSHHRCYDCGYVWQHGQHGGHDCKANIKAQRDRYRQELLFQAQCDPSDIDEAFFKLNKPVVNRRNGEANQRWADARRWLDEIAGELHGWPHDERHAYAPNLLPGMLRRQIAEARTITLDQPPPTEPGWYFVNWFPPLYHDSWQFAWVSMIEGRLYARAFGATEAIWVGQPALWSRRIDIATSSEITSTTKQRSPWESQGGE